MIILSNGLTDKADEGFLNVANNLVKRIKKAKPEALVVSYERSSVLTDKYLRLNKLLLNSELISLIKNCSDSILYIPFPAKTIATALRIFIISLFKHCRLDVILVMKSDMNLLAKLLIRLSGANIIVFSKEAEEFYKNILPSKKVRYLKIGVDTKKFIPISDKKKKELKIKYGFDDRPIILHVGHLKMGRNIAELKKINSNYQVVLVTSTLFASEKDTELRNELLKRDNIKIIEDYIPDIQEIYQMSDVYFFPVLEQGHCIDVPLSCLEAASCNKPIITTNYGEMKEFKGKNGFFFIYSFEKENLSLLIEKAFHTENVNTREVVLEYDWDNAILCLNSEVES